jgi:hypothetical protein
LETFTFQAPEFYKKNGYIVFAELDQVVGEHRWYFSLPKIKYNTNPVLEEIQRLRRGLYRLSRNGYASDGHVETDAWKRVTANVELHAQRTFRKNFQAAAIVDSELGADVCEARGGSGLIFCPGENRAQAGGSIRRDPRDRDRTRRLLW